MTAGAAVAGSSRQEQWLPILELAVQEVFSIMLGTSLSLVSRAENAGPIEFTAIVGLAGSLRGILTFGCGAQSATQIAAHMLNNEMALPENQVAYRFHSLAGGDSLELVLKFREAPIVVRLDLHD